MTADESARPAPVNEANGPMIRVGQGFDVHPWSDDPSRTLVLGGVRFDGHAGLAGHSDADVIAHACTDAMLGAAGLGDIGQLFPDTDPTHADADSLVLLATARDRLGQAGWVLVNADVTVILDSPKVADRRQEMMDRLSEAAGGPVSLKGKRTEGVAGLLGGVHCHAVALITRSPAPSPSAPTKNESTAS